MIEKWNTLEVKNLGDQKIFNLYKVKREHPTLHKQGDFYVLDSPPWVNIIPITKSGKIVLIKQYRHGSNSVTIEIPGGLVEKGEDCQFAAERECAEETGYISSNKAILLGENLPNPAFLNNTCKSFLLTDCEKKQSQHLDANEDIEVFEASVDDIKNMINKGEINHSLVLTAFFFYFIKNDTIK